MNFKRLTAFLVAIVMMFAMIPCSSAADIEIISIETIDLGDGLTAEITTAVISSSLSSRAARSTVSGHKSGIVRQGTTKIGEFMLFGSFDYNGSKAEAVSDDWDARTASGYDYDGSSYCSGASVKGSCRFTGNGIDRTLLLTLTCDKNGNLS